MSKISFSDVPITNRKYEKSYSKAFLKLLKSGQFIQGKEVFEFEKDLKNFIGAKYATTVASGTDALIVSLMALGIKPGDEVITTSFSWLSSTQSILMVGATPRFVDIDLRNMLIDEELIEEKINENTKAIMVVSLFGTMNNFTNLKKISRKFNIPLIEDAAQSFGSSRNGHFSCNSADISCTSFFPTKSLGGLGDGGAIFTNNFSLYEKARMIKLNGQSIRNRSSMMGYNARIDTLQAVFLRIKLKKLNSFIKAKRKIVKIYSENIVTNSNCNIVAKNFFNTSCCSSFNILFKKRKKLIQEFNAKNIQYAIYYDKPINDQLFIKKSKFKDITPKARYASNNIISLPLNIYLKKENILKICKIINNVSK